MLNINAKEVLILAEYPIIMKQKNNQGDYDILYPKTLGSQVEGMTLDQVSGKLASNRIDGDIPSSQITGLPTSLPANGGNADTVENQTVTQIIEAAISQSAKIVKGSYVGTGTYGVNNPCTLTFDFAPQLVVVQGNKLIGANDSTILGIFFREFKVYLLAERNGISVTGTTTWGENSVSWYNSGYVQQLNYYNSDYGAETYFYWALG